MKNEPTSSDKVLRPEFPATSVDRQNRRKTDNPTGGDGGNGMEARLAKVESDIEYIKRDVGEINADIKELKSDVKDEFKEVKGEFKDVKKEIKDDFRITFGALILVAVSLAGMMAKGFDWL